MVKGDIRQQNMQNRQQAKERIDKLIKTCSLSGIDGIMLSKMTTFEMEESRTYDESAEFR